MTNHEQKLAEMVVALADAGIETLVMGGHAARYYGIDRNTNDYVLVTSLSSPGALRLRLASIERFRNVRSAPACHDDFARFEIGRLPDGREEYLEFWIRNHLLADFPQLKRRAEIGAYGGRRLPFLSLEDLIHSKETERESDWLDIALLEEILDARNLAAFRDGKCELATLLANLRSRRGMGMAVERGLLDDRGFVGAAMALALARLSVTFAFLLPFGDSSRPCAPIKALDENIQASLGTVQAGSARHFALVEIVRRARKRRAMDTDRDDKKARVSQESPRDRG